jgi:hypothetical protein
MPGAPLSFDSYLAGDPPSGWFLGCYRLRLSVQSCNEETECDYNYDCIRGVGPIEAAPYVCEARVNAIFLVVSLTSCC